jgi:hypothetical protein
MGIKRKKHGDAHALYEGETHRIDVTKVVIIIQSHHLSRAFLLCRADADDLWSASA